MTDNLDLFAQPEPPPTQGPVKISPEFARELLAPLTLNAAGELVYNTPEKWHGKTLGEIVPPELHVKRKPSRKGPQRTIQEGFESFIARNPHMVDLIVVEAREWKRSGRKQYGMAAIWEHVRYSIDKRSIDSKPFKMPNNYRSRMARHIMANYPDLDGFFTTAELRSE